MSFTRPGKGQKGRLGGYTGGALDALSDCSYSYNRSRQSRSANKAPDKVNRFTHHAVDRAGERGVSKKEVERLQSLAAANVRGEETVATAAGTTAVVRDGKVVTVYRRAAADHGDALRSSAQHVDMGSAVVVPKQLLDRHGREMIHRVEAKLTCPSSSICRIQVPYITPGDPVLVPLAVVGAPLDTVQRELELALGPWKVIDDVLPGLIVGQGGKTIRLLQALVPACTIHPANKGAMCGDEQDKRTVLRGTP